MASIDVSGVRLEVRGVQGMVTLVGFVLMAAAIADQMKRPAQQRNWNGTLWGVVPYDLRPPTLARMLRAFWNPDDERILTGKAFGVGWSINVAALREKLGLASRM